MATPRPSSTPSPAGRSTPTLWVVWIDSEAHLADQLVSEHRVAWVETSHPYVTEELLEPVALEGACAAGQIERAIDDLVGAVDHELPGRHEAHGPVLVLDTVGPVGT